MKVAVRRGLYTGEDILSHMHRIMLRVDNSTMVPM